MAKLTDAFIRSLQVPEGEPDTQAFDDELHGFGVRNLASGKASLFVKYSIGKQQRRKTLGPWVPGALPEARQRPGGRGEESASAGRPAKDAGRARAGLPDGARARRRVLEQAAAQDPNRGDTLSHEVMAAASRQPAQ